MNFPQNCATFYNFISIKAQMLRRPVKKFVLFMGKIRYQKQQPKDSLVAFVLEISMSKMLLAVGDQSQKKWMIFWQESSKTGM